MVRAEPMRFGKDANDTSGEGVKETVRLVVLPLFNAYNFLTTYALADGWSPTQADLEVHPSGDTRSLDPLARAALPAARCSTSTRTTSSATSCPRSCGSRTSSTTGTSAAAAVATGARPARAARATATSARPTPRLFRVLVTVTRAMAPVMPFFCEYLYQRLMVDTGLAEAGDSVHLTRFPNPDEKLLDLDLEARMQAARDVVGLGLVIREREKIGVRRPLGQGHRGEPRSGACAPRAAVQRGDPRLSST